MQAWQPLLKSKMGKTEQSHVQVAFAVAICNILVFAAITEFYQRLHGHIGEALINSLMERVCLQLLLIARRRARACPSIYAKGCNTASTAATNPKYIQHNDGVKRCAPSLQHLAMPTRPTVLSACFGLRKL